MINFKPPIDKTSDDYRPKLLLQFERLSSLYPNDRNKVKTLCKNKTEDKDRYQEYMADEVVEEYLKKYSSFNGSAYYQTPKHQRLMLFIDLALLKNPNEHGFSAYETRAPGSLVSMNDAFEYLRDTQDDPLSVEYIRQLHEKALAKVITKRQEFRGWGDTVTVESQGDHAGYIRDERASGGYITCLVNCVTYFGLFKVFSKFERVEYLGEGNDALRFYVKYPYHGHAHKMDKLIKKYEEKVQVVDPLKKLKTIVGFIQSLDFLHPFLDGNTRTFETLLLNRELIRHHFSPTILQDPNLFLVSSKREALYYVLKGMDHYDQFIKTGTLPNCGSIEDICHRAKSPNPLAGI